MRKRMRMRMKTRTRLWNDKDEETRMNDEEEGKDEVNEMLLAGNCRR